MSIENLDNRSRARHTAFMQYVFAQMGITNNSGKPIKLLTRLGSRRSADGVVFDIGKGKVAKCIFTGRSVVNSIDTIKKEYKLAKMMSDVGAGPKVYSMKEFTLPANILNLKNQAGPLNWPNTPTMRRLMVNYYKTFGYATKNVEKEVNDNIALNPKHGINRAFSFNLFQGWWATPNRGYDKVKTGAVIVMENLYSGPGVKDATTLYDYVVKEKKPMPLKEIAAVMKKMHALKIAHLDLHAGNIMVQTKTDGSIRVVIIDFGRATSKAKKINMNFNINTVANFAAYAKVRPTNINAAFERTVVQRQQLTNPLPSYGLVKAASGGYRIAGKRGLKKVDLNAFQLRLYAANKGIPFQQVQKAKKKEILNMIYAAKGAPPPLPVKPLPAAASSYGLVFNQGSVRMRGKKGLIKPTKLTVAQLKAYAAKKGINLMGAKLKKDILRRVAK